jgi:hypothetical protein
LPSPTPPPLFENSGRIPVGERILGVRCPLPKYKQKKNKLSWVAGLGSAQKAVLLFLRLSVASEGETGVVPPSNSWSLPSPGKSGLPQSALRAPAGKQCTSMVSTAAHGPTPSVSRMQGEEHIIAPRIQLSSTESLLQLPFQLANASRSTSNSTTVQLRSSAAQFNSSSSWPASPR